MENTGYEIYKYGYSKRTYNGKPIKYIQFKMNERISRDETVETVRGMLPKLRKNKKYIMSGAWNVSGWKSGHMFTKDDFNDDNIYDFNKRYDLHNTDQNLTHFVLYELDDTNEGGADKNNDCFYKCLMQGVNQNNDALPNELRNPKKIKQYVNKKRCSKISIDDIKKMLPLLLDHDISIQIENHINTEEKKFNIQIKLESGHYSIINTNDKFIKECEKSMFKFREKSKYDKRLFTYYIDIEENNIHYYDGINDIKQMELTEDNETKVMTRKNCINIRVNNEKELKSKHEEYLKNASDLLKRTNGKLDLLKYKNVNACMKDILLETIKTSNVELEDIDNLEDDILYNCYHHGGCGFTYHKNDYEGEIHTADAISAYPSTFISKTNIPTGKPNFYTLQDTDFKTYQSNGRTCKSFKYGCYRVNLSNYENTEKYFRVKKCTNWYTHDELKYAQEFGITVNLINDNEINAMIYDKAKLIEAFRLFNGFIYKIVNLKREKIGGNVPKQMLNNMTGMLAKQNKFTDYGKDMKITELSQVHINNMYPSLEGETLEYCTKKRFAFPFARATVFLTAKFKSYIQKQIKPIAQHVVRCYTDSISVTNKECLKGFDFGTDLKQWKYEGKIYGKITKNKLSVRCDKCEEYFNKTKLRDHHC